MEFNPVAMVIVLVADISVHVECLVSCLCTHDCSRGLVGAGLISVLVVVSSQQ